MSTHLNIQKYAGGWGSPLQLERLFADSLKSDSRVTEFQPEEIERKQKSDLTASNVVGALSSKIIGVGWKTTHYPASIIAFKSCSAQLATFILKENFMQARFFFPILSKAYYKWWKLSFVRRKGAGVFSSGNPNELEIEGTPPGVERMRSDASFNKEFLSLANMGLNHKPWICTIGTEVLAQQYVGKIEFDIHHKKKKWEKAITEKKLAPEGYVYHVFNGARLIAHYAQEQMKAS